MSLCQGCRHLGAALSQERNQFLVVILELGRAKEGLP